MKPTLIDELMNNVFEQQKLLVKLIVKGIDYDEARHIVYGKELVDKVDSLFSENELPAMKLIDSNTKQEFEPSQSKPNTL